MAQPPRGRARRNLEGSDSSSEANGLVVQGTVAEALPNAMFAVELDNGQKVISHITGAVRTRLVRVVPGDRVTVQLSPYDLSRGRITERQR